MPKVDKSKIFFDGKPHEYEVPELYPLIESYHKDNKDVNDKELKNMYETYALGRAIGLKPSFFENGITDNLLFTDEEQEEWSLDDAIVRDYNDYFKEAEKQKAKSIEEISQDAKNYLIAKRMKDLFIVGQEKAKHLPALQEFALESFNPEARAKKAAWEYKPKFLEKDKPKEESVELSDNDLYDDGWDESTPMWLRTPSKKTPWGINHPMRKKFVTEAPKAMDLIAFDTRLKMMDYMYGTKDESEK